MTKLKDIGVQADGTGVLWPSNYHKYLEISPRSLQTPTNGQLMANEAGVFVYDNGKWVAIVDYPIYHDADPLDKLEEWTDTVGRSLHRPGDEVGQPVSHRSAWQPASSDRDVPNLAVRPT